MRKLKQYLLVWLGGRKVKGLAFVTPVDIDQLCEIAAGIQTEFISENIKKVLDKCGILTKRKGIGWEVLK